MGAEAALRERLARLTDTQPGDWFPVLKARYGMLAAFEALAARGESRVVTQALTCATAVDPIMAAGLAPVYADIDAGSFSVAAAALPADGAGAVVIQHTFGVVDAAAADVARAARAAGAAVFEDSAHCATRLARDAAGAPLADVSFHSFGVEKVLPTKFGGAVWVNPAMADASLREHIVARLSALPAPGGALSLAVRTYRLQRGVLNRLPGALAAPLERALAAARLFEPAVAPAETRGRLTRAGVAAGPAVASGVLAALDGLKENLATRAAAVDAYLEALGGAVAEPARLAGQPLVRLPLLVPDGVDPEAVFSRLRARGVQAGRWYRPVLFPGTATPEAYHYTPGDPALPVTHDVVARLVNLPTLVSPERAREIAAEALAAMR